MPAIASDINELEKQSCNCFSKIDTIIPVSFEIVQEVKKECITNILADNSFLFRDIKLRDSFFKSMNCIDEKINKLVESNKIELPSPFELPDPFEDVLLADIILDVKNNGTGVKQKYLQKAVSFSGVLSEVYSVNDNSGVSLIGFKGNIAQHPMMAGYGGYAFCSIDHFPEMFEKYNNDYDFLDSDNEKYIVKISGDITEVDSETKRTILGSFKQYWIRISNGFITEVNDKKIEDYSTTPVKEETAVKKELSQELTASPESLLKGVWEGEMGGKPLLINLNQVSRNNLKGYNKLGDNKRPIEGTFVEANWDQPCSKAYSAVLSEPGDDKWDGVFTIKFIGYNDEVEGEYGPECNPNSFVSFEAMGEWKSNNGKLERSFTLTKVK